jgi:hypothetical protein
VLLFKKSVTEFLFKALHISKVFRYMEFFFYQFNAYTKFMKVHNTHHGVIVLETQLRLKNQL